MPKTADRLNHFTESVIREMTREANRYGAINLSQGFPDADPPPEVLAAGKKVGGPMRWSNRKGFSFFQASSDSLPDRPAGAAVGSGTWVGRAAGACAGSGVEPHADSSKAAITNVTNRIRRIVHSPPYSIIEFRQAHRLSLARENVPQHL